MANFQNVNTLLRTIVIGGLVLIAGWWTLFLRGKLSDHQAELAASQEEVVLLADQLEEREASIKQLGSDLMHREEEILTLAADVEQKEKEIRALDVALQLLKVDHRIARIEVLAQSVTGAEPGQVRTRLRFTELDAAGQPLGAGREITVDGKTVYVETLVVKFGDDYVEQGDTLRGTSICLFKRLFGENQKPSEGVMLDAEGLQPLAYTGVEGPDPLHRELWDRFWDYANDRELARQLGVRAMHGEAPFIETRPGMTYRVVLRASGGLTIQPE
jgi:hypothetical protein